VVTVGGIDRTSTETEEKTQVSTEAKYHEKYDDYWAKNDIAVIKLAKPFTLSKTFKNSNSTLIN